MSWVVVGVVNAGSSIVSKRQAKKDAKNQRIKNEKIERMNNILDVLGGGSAGGFNSNQQAITGSTFADILSGAGSIGQAAGSAIQQKAQKKIDADAVTQKNKVDASLINARDASALASLMRAINPSSSGGSKAGSRTDQLGTSRWRLGQDQLPNMNASFFPGQGVLDPSRPSRNLLGIPE